MLAPTWVVNVVVDAIETTENLSPIVPSGKTPEPIPTPPEVQVNPNPVSNTSSLYPILRLCLLTVVISKSPVKLSYAAVVIPFTAPLYAVPTNEVIAPEPLSWGFTFAGSKGAYPNPPVEPRDTITPPLGNSFWLTSISLLVRIPPSVIPENVSVVIPDVPSSVITKLPFELLFVVGLWNMLLMNRIPFPPVSPIPVVELPPDFNSNVCPIPVNWFDISSYILFVE